MRNRKPNRWKDYNYSRNGLYFLTICTKNRRDYFGTIVGDNDRCSLQLSDIGIIAQTDWLAIPDHFNAAKLDEFVIMPNHIHGILIVDNGDDHSPTGNNPPVGNNDRCSLRGAGPRNMELIPKIISQYKSSVTREIRKQYGNHEFGWQKSYHDRIIRGEKSLNRIRNYIRNNPENWERDRNNIDRQSLSTAFGMKNKF